MKYIEHTVIEHLCEDCDIPVGDHEGFPHYVDERTGNYYCIDCALKGGFIGADEWLRFHGIGIYDHAIYKDGKIFAYRKWGKGFCRNIIEPFEEE